MTQGILLFAHDNEQVQYSLLSAWQAKRIHKWLDKPVSIVADQRTVDNLGKHTTLFDNIIISERIATQKKSYNGQQLTFNNIDRSMAWELTPYDETLIMDTDIVIQSSRLNQVWNNDADMLVCDNCIDVFGRNFLEFERLSAYSINFVWATECYFKKNSTTKMFFDLCNYIKANYSWYAHLYKIPSAYIRNDYVWSIALQQLKGDWVLPAPSALHYTLDKDNVVNMTDNSVTVLSNTLAKVEHLDLHVMNKFDLLEHVKKELNV